MPDITLEVRWSEFVSDLNVPVSAWRSYARARFLDTGGSEVAYSCVVDSGAPLSVIPYSLWHDRSLQWQLLGTQLTRNGKVAPNALDWFGVTCHLGATRIYLLSPDTGTEAGPFLLVGKFAQGRQARAEYELTAILGLNFLTDNVGGLALNGGSGQLNGFLSVP